MAKANETKTAEVRETVKENLTNMENISSDAVTEDASKKLNAIARIKALASQVSGTSPLTIGREKVDTKTVCSYPSLTLRDFDFIQYTDKSNNEEVKYPVLIFDEIEDGFYCGGMALGDLCRAIMEDEELLDILHSEGLKLSFESTRTKSGNTYVNFSVL